MKFKILLISLTSISLCVCNAAYKFESSENGALPNIFDDAIEQIGKLSHGKKLLQFISVNAGDFELLIKEGEQDAFIGNSAQPCLYIRSDSSKCYVGAPVFSDDKLIVDDHYVVPIGKVEIPTYITIAHELIHYAHFLENQSAYKCRLTKDPILYKDKYSSCDFCQSYVSKNRITSRYNSLFPNEEEELTVLGYPNVIEGSLQNISESLLMVEAGIVRRYAYQSVVGDYIGFFECENVFTKIFGSIIKRITNEYCVGININATYDYQSVFDKRHEEKLGVFFKESEESKQADMNAWTEMANMVNEQPRKVNKRQIPHKFQKK